MTQEEKLEQAKSLYKDANADQRYVLESLFPELKESEDEEPSEIRKHLRDIIVKNFPVENLDNRIYSLRLDDEALDKASEELLELAKKEMERKAR